MLPSPVAHPKALAAKQIVVTGVGAVVVTGLGMPSADGGQVFEGPAVENFQQVRVAAVMVRPYD
jgi:hypothetical protein